MKIIREPEIYIVGRQEIDDIQLDKFLADHGVSWESDSSVAAEVLTETAGRVCYMSFAKPRPGGNRAYLGHIKEAGHGSITEHAVWNFVITGVSRSLTHELIRHRAGMGFSQLSQRYVDESVAEYVEPDIIANDPELHAIWISAINQSHQAYKAIADKLFKVSDCGSNSCRMANRGDGRQRNNGPCRCTPEQITNRRKFARQAARSVLPNATETKIFVTANARAIRNYLEQRGSRFAEPEIRKLANKLLDLMLVESPNLFGDYERVQLGDGTFEITTKYRKV